MHEMDDLDRVLADDDMLVPSSGFAARVMDALRDDPAEAAPLAFPWRPFLIGVVACVIWAASAIQLMTRIDRTVLRELAAQVVEVGTLPLYMAAVVIATLIVLGFRRTLARR